MRDWSVPEPPANGALMLIDFQSDFLDDAGRMPVARNHVEAALSAAASAARLYKQHGQPVVAIGNQFRRRDYVMNLLRGYAALEGSPGAGGTHAYRSTTSPSLPNGRRAHFAIPTWQLGSPAGASGHW